MKTLLVALSLLLAVPAFAQDVEVKGKKFGPTVSVDGKDLKRVGAGLRKKWGFSVYAMGVYTEGGACDAGQVIKAEEAKYLRLDFLRDVPLSDAVHSPGAGADHDVRHDALGFECLDHADVSEAARRSAASPSPSRKAIRPSRSRKIGSKGGRARIRPPPVPA